MANGNKHIGVPEIVLRVMEQFLAVMSADPDIPDDAISRLGTLLRKGAVPNPDAINAALFEPPAEGET